MRSRGAGDRQPAAAWRVLHLHHLDRRQSSLLLLAPACLVSLLRVMPGNQPSTKNQAEQTTTTPATTQKTDLARLRLSGTALRQLPSRADGASWCARVGFLEARCPDASPSSDGSSGLRTLRPDSRGHRSSTRNWFSDLLASAWFFCRADQASALLSGGAPLLFVTYSRLRRRSRRERSSSAASR